MLFMKMSKVKTLSFNPGTLLGRPLWTMTSKSDHVFGKNQYCGTKAVVHRGLRFISEDQKQRARAKMLTIVANSLPQTESNISFVDSYPAMQPTQGNMSVLKELSDVSLAMGQGAVVAYDPAKEELQIFPLSLMTRMVLTV